LRSPRNNNLTLGPRTAPPPPPIRSDSAEPMVTDSEQPEEPTSPIITINTFGVQRDQARASLYHREEEDERFYSPEEAEEEIYAEPGHWSGMGGGVQPEYMIYGPSLMSFMSSASGPGGMEPSGYGGLDSITEVRKFVKKTSESS
jgi:hypothetical protein